MTSSLFMSFEAHPAINHLKLESSPVYAIE